MSGDLITVTLVLAATGQSESMSVPSRATTVADLLEWAAALFGVDGHNVALLKDGKPLLLQLPQPNIVTTFSLHDAGIVEGDLLAVVAKQPQHPPATPAASSSRATTAGVAPPTAAAAASPPVGGLDFSSLLGTAAAGAAAAQSPSVPQPVVVDPPSEPVYYPDMNLQEAQQYNPHPMAMVKLLFSKEHLSKELNYYDPVLASKLLRSDLTMEQAAAVWRQAMVKGGIESAMRASSKFHQEQTMKQRLSADPNDAEAVAFFAVAAQQKRIDEQYRHVIEEYPESMGRVHMLYIAAKINGHVIQAFCDSGAQSTIMSKKLAIECDVADLIDERMAGIAVGVGTGKILGRIHSVQLQIGNYHFPCSVTVMDDPVGSAKEMPFLLGLDMMKRHTCLLDFERGCLKFRLSPGNYMETPFLHEKDLSEAQGGTKGFDADRANQEFMAMRQQEEDGDENMEEDDTKA